MDRKQEKWAIFWCDLLSPIIYGEIDKEATNQFLKDLSQKSIRFPDGPDCHTLAFHPAAQIEPLPLRRV